ncbi:hypothetical protein [Flavihumibacter petaseus]|uniref:Uncharacterized protein n=1 Tax=Flavihumibacter petaseus NBRC 106054 TaxID=1220578 RepID=A0A0E9N161_9BACT|nr:hypothetical protein [Flavihumibacter petaseus]GAO43767.1 hypothetical protein FPE01S_02_08730 [Flavihumibacter petaseus NBRC 106054]
MAHQSVQQKYETLVDKVRRMRKHQINWFNLRVSDDLRAAKKLEREVDALLSQEIPIQKPNQTDLFNGNRS